MNERPRWRSAGRAAAHIVVAYDSRPSAYAVEHVSRQPLRHRDFRHGNWKTELPCFRDDPCPRPGML
jgi:hypothetical protein